jgi:thioredoxin 1
VKNYKRNNTLMKTCILIFFLICTSSLQAQVADSMKFISLSPKEFKERLAQTKDAIIIDVREASDYRKGHLKASHNIPFTKGLDVAADTTGKFRHLFIYCYAGGRSKKAAIFFYGKGFRNLYSMKGGMIGWKAAGLPVTRRKSK